MKIVRPPVHKDSVREMGVGGGGGEREREKEGGGEKVGWRDGGEERRKSPVHKKEK